ELSEQTTVVLSSQFSQSVGRQRLGRVLLAFGQFRVITVSRRRAGIDDAFDLRITRRQEDTERAFDVHPIALQRLPHRKFNRWERRLVEHILDALHGRSEELSIKDAAFYHVESAHPTFRSEFIVHGLYIGALHRG